VVDGTIGSREVPEERKLVVKNNNSDDDDNNNIMRDRVSWHFGLI
jgi:hypothetical protein